jgi:F0F1-type ATP synthase assembly protein I
MKVPNRSRATAVPLLVGVAFFGYILIRAVGHKQWFLVVLAAALIAFGLVSYCAAWLRQARHVSRVHTIDLRSTEDRSQRE